MGDDPSKAPVDTFGPAFELANLFVVNASTLVTSAAVNPSLTGASLAMRAQDRIAMLRQFQFMPTAVNNDLWHQK